LFVEKGFPCVFLSGSCTFCLFNLGRDDLVACGDVLYAQCSVGVDHAVVRFFFFLKLRQSEFERQATRWFRAHWTGLVVPLAMVRTFFLWQIWGGPWQHWVTGWWLLSWSGVRSDVTGAIALTASWFRDLALVGPMGPDGTVPHTQSV
jgi:hypothetical protein